MTASGPSKENLDDLMKSSTSNKQKDTVMNDPDSDDSLEDEDLRFIGYCYTTTGENDKTQHSCLYCPSVFDSLIDFTNHMKLHGTVKEMTCEFCDFSCSDKKTMKAHREFHGIIPVHGRRLGSDKKQQQTASFSEKKQQLEDNLQTSSNKNANTSSNGHKQGSQQKQNQAHKSHEIGCVICPYRTNQTSKFEQHMIGHCKQSGYVCSVCNFKHDYKRWLHVHCMLHSDEGVDYQWPPEFVKECDSTTNN